MGVVLSDGEHDHGSLHSGPFVSLYPSLSASVFLFISGYCTFIRAAVALSIPVEKKKKKKKKNKKPPVFLKAC